MDANTTLNASILLLGLALASCHQPIAPMGVQDAIAAELPNSVDLIINDMQLPHEGRPHGVPASYDWAFKPRVGRGNNPGSFQALIAWGQLYEDIQGNPAKNTRVQIRNIKTYLLSRQTNRWVLLQSSRWVNGAAYREDFSANLSQPADIRDEGDGSLSVRTEKGYNFHFWPPQRKSINPQDVAGIFTTVQARLIVHNPSKPDDRNKAKYLLSMGGDYWSTLHAQWQNFQTNYDIGIGRFRYVKRQWQSFNMTTLSPKELRKNPPPL